MTNKEQKKLEGTKHHKTYMEKTSSILRKQLVKELQEEGFAVEKELFYYKGRGCKTVPVFNFELGDQIIAYDLNWASKSLGKWYENELSLIDTLKLYDENVRDQYIKTKEKDSIFQYVRESCPTFSQFVESVKQLCKENGLTVVLQEKEDFDLD